MRYNPFGNSWPLPKAVFTNPTRTSRSITTSRTGAYNTGISEQNGEDKANEDGAAGVLDPAVVGVNSHPHAVDALVHGHGAATGVISYDARGDLQAVDSDLEKELLTFKSAEAVALEANGDYEAAKRELILQERRMKATGLPIPSKRAFFLLVAAMIGLFVGDWGLITLGYQVLGLSDHPWIPGMAFTDDLHLAAFSSVFALVVLGEAAGGRLRGIEYALDNRRRADQTERAKLPKPAGFDIFWLIVCLIGALGALVALSSIRSDYLKALGADTGGLAFFCIQLAILLAAIALGFAHANPEAKRWKSSQKKAGAAEAARTAATALVTELGGRINAGIDQRDTVLAQAGHHVRTDAANVGVQTSAFKRRYLLSQLEPVQEGLFGEHMSPKEHSNAELLTVITGITQTPDFEKVSTDAVIQAIGKTRARLHALRARIDQVEINKLNLPELDENPEPAADTTENAPMATPLRPVTKTAATDLDVDENTEESA